MAKNSESSVNKTGIAVGLASIAAAAVGAYWLYGSKHSAKHRKVAASWMLKARADVMDSVANLTDVSKDAYFNIVDAAVKKYSDLQSSASDVTSITKDLKSAWAHINKATKSAKKVAKK